MADLIYDQDDELILWAEDIMPGARFREDARAIGTARDGEILAACIFDTFSTTSCFVHIVSDGNKRWLTKEFLVHCMAYPFHQCGFRRINAIISASNEASLRFAEGFGWVREGLLREAGEEGEDVILFGMLREECRWLPPGALVI